jgi:DNA-binding response OmpR family regulator
MAVVLLVDDERAVRTGMARFLEGEGFEVETARDGVEALEKFSARTPDLVLLDVMMPRCNGFTACAEIRRLDPTVPIVFLTAMDSEAELVRALGLGADDFLSKSSGDAGKIARIRSALARHEAHRSASWNRRVALGRMTADIDSLTLSEDGRIVERLTKTEGDILSYLASRRGNIVSRGEIVDALRGEGFACEDGMLYVHVSNLRRKLGAAAALVVSERGAGYRLLK